MAHIEVTRGGEREAVHPFTAVMAEDTEVRWSVGEPVNTFWRSASKPFQLLNSLLSMNPSDIAGLDAESLAVGAASHSGQKEHVERVQMLLQRFGLAEDQLQCGAHPPMHEASAKAVSEPTAIHNNCSGKHTFMLAACAAQGWPLDYRPSSHPLQQKNLALLNQLTGAEHRVAIDGCSVPTFFAPLSSMVFAFSRLASAMTQEDPTQDSNRPKPANEDAQLARIGWAMNSCPFMVSGEGRLDLAVSQQASEPLAVKVGAEGVFGIARPNARQGVLVKVHSGNADALALAVRWALTELGVKLSGEWPWATLKNVRGVEVGKRTVFV